jgi:hypothetical protein
LRGIWACNKKAHEIAHRENKEMLQSMQMKARHDEKDPEGALKAVDKWFRDLVSA